MNKVREEALSLPKTRIDLLKEIVHYRFIDIVFVSIYTFCFSIPIFIWLIFSNYSYQENINNIVTVSLIYGVLIILIAFLGLGIGGAMFFAKKLVWGQGANPHKDFFVGIKKNGKVYFVTFLLIGILYFALHVGGGIINSSTSINDYVKGIIQGLLYLSFILVLLFLFYILSQSVIYKATTFQLINNAIRFTFGAIGKNILILLVVLLPWFTFEFIPFAIAEWISVAISGIFYFGFSTIIFTLYSHSIFDKTINMKQYPEIYRKGLNKDESNHDFNEPE